MKKIFLAIIFSLVFLSLAIAATPRQLVDKGNSLFQKGKYEEATKSYKEALRKRPESGIINFNLGNARYKAGDYDNAVEYFNKALLSEDAKLRQKAYYNLGNSYYFIGRGKENRDISAAIKDLEKSLGHYQSALKIDAKDKDAQFNYNLVKKELERLKQKQKEQRRREQSSAQKKSSLAHKQQSQRPSSSKQNKQEAKTKEKQRGSSQKKSPSQKQNQENKQPQESQGKKGEGQESQKEEAQPQKERAKKQKNQKAKSAEQKGQGKMAGVPQSSSGASAQVKQISPQEAKMLLENYQQAEEPKKPLSFYLLRRNKGQEYNVDKDW